MSSVSAKWEHYNVHNIVQPMLNAADPNKVSNWRYANAAYSHVCSICNLTIVVFFLATNVLLQVPVKGHSVIVTGISVVVPIKSMANL